MQGFFTKKQTESNSRPGGKLQTCSACGLYQHCQTPRMEAVGKFKKGIINIGDFLTRTDDAQGLPFQGPEGRMLRDTLHRAGIDLWEDCLNTTAVRCYFEDDKTGTQYIQACRKSLLQLVQKHKPRIIICHGYGALFGLIGHRYPGDFYGIDRWRGFQIPDQDIEAIICPTYSLTDVFRDKNPATQLIWDADVRASLRWLEKPFPKNTDPVINIIEMPKVIKGKESQPVAIDYETTGLKPHAPGHRIVCAAWAPGPDIANVCMMPGTRKERQPWVDFLQDTSIQKMAHNMKFEENWSVVRLGASVANWGWDSMQAAHILDNRPYISGLKFQTYVNFGVIDYASEISPYLKGIEQKNGNSLNRVMELLDIPGGAEQLMTYCAWDVIWEYRLAMKQKQLIYG